MSTTEQHEQTPDFEKKSKLSSLLSQIPHASFKALRLVTNPVGKMLRKGGQAVGAVNQEIDRVGEKVAEPFFKGVVVVALATLDWGIVYLGYKEGIDEEMATLCMYGGMSSVILVANAAAAYHFAIKPFRNRGN